MAHLAASIGSLETLLLLAQYGADFELQTPKGIKPIHDAAANGQTGMISLLCKQKLYNIYQMFWSIWL